MYYFLCSAPKTTHYVTKATANSRGLVSRQPPSAHVGKYDSKHKFYQNLSVLNLFFLRTQTATKKSLMKLRHAPKSSLVSASHAFSFLEEKNRQLQHRRKGSLHPSK
ncbi:hypothetical protein IscW_ISCW002282 [Ixodes scapularis]|uniref:Uncharacterized protein n=1 Tax=Ixodes scapularis TaxID=6945 RepID=B7P8F0_IXOSC|nr:hypothetical protein IscW_ISCW002282 [Ixodes scapularis]|eukprot:XP_002401905.1 hypothetical protein IscW_ISCW002282 [Ixodes scapularis]